MATRDSKTQTHLIGAVHEGHNGSGAVLALCDGDGTSILEEQAAGLGPAASRSFVQRAVILVHP
jgi:hypothetical protein